MSQVNKYADKAGYTADKNRKDTQSAVSYIENDGMLVYDGVNVVVDKPAAGVGDLAVFDKTTGTIRFVKGATLLPAQLPTELVPVAVVYARQGERVLIVSLEGARFDGLKSVRWAHPYEVALSGFDIDTGGTIVLTLGSGSVTVTYPAGASLADIASAINSTLKGGTPDYSSPNYGGWAATPADGFVVMSSNTYNDLRAGIAVSGCQITYTPENVNYQLTLTGALIEGSVEYIRRENGANKPQAGCNPEKFLQYYSTNGSQATGQVPGSAEIIRESVFTEEANPALVAAYPTYRDYLFGEHLLQYPAAYGALLRDGKTNTAKLGDMRFVDIYGQNVLCSPVVAAVLNYGIAVNGMTTGLEAGAWWLPSVEEVYLLMHDRALTAADVEKDPVNRTLSRLGKDTCYGSGYYPWTSCECNYNSVYIYSGNDGTVSAYYKYGSIPVRPVCVL